MYIVTRKDLSCGIQAVQGIHAAAEFAIQYPQTHQEWHQNSNYLGFLSVENECELEKLIARAHSENIKISIFREPDIGNEVTAITIEPGSKSKKNFIIN